MSTVLETKECGECGEATECDELIECKICKYLFCGYCISWCEYCECNVCYDDAGTIHNDMSRACSDCAAEFNAEEETERYAREQEVSKLFENSKHSDIVKHYMSSHEKIIDYYFKGGNFGNIQKCVSRAVELVSALLERRLDLRSDSALCSNYIWYGRDPAGGGLEEIVDIMDEMRFYHEQTMYASILSDLNSEDSADSVEYVNIDMFDEYEREEFFHERACRAHERYENRQDNSELAKAEARKQWMKANLPLTSDNTAKLPLHWQNREPQIK